MRVNYSPTDATPLTVYGNVHKPFSVEFISHHFDLSSLSKRFSNPLSLFENVHSELISISLFG